MAASSTTCPPGVGYLESGKAITCGLPGKYPHTSDDAAVQGGDPPGTTMAVSGTAVAARFGIQRKVPCATSSSGNGTGSVGAEEEPTSSWGRKTTQLNDSKEVAPLVELPKDELKTKGGQTNSATTVQTKNVTTYDSLMACYVDAKGTPNPVESEYWLNDFTHRAKTDLDRVGHHVERRCASITTSTNPYMLTWLQIVNCRSSFKLVWMRV